MPQISAELGFQRTRKLQSLVKTVRRPDKWLTDRYFGNRITLDTEFVQIDTVKRGRRMATYVHPRAQARTVQREGYATKVFKPPTIREKKIITPDDKLLRRYGENISDQTPEERLAATRIDELDDLRDRVDRRIEWAAAQAIVEGKQEVIGDGIDVELDFGRSDANSFTLTGDDRWGQADMDVRGTFQRLSSAIGAEGLRADDVLLGDDALSALLADEATEKALDNRRTEAGFLTLTNLPDNVEYLGNLYGFDLFHYKERYVDDLTDEEEPLIPADQVVMCSRGAQAKLYFGVIEDLRASIQMEYFVKTWQQEDPSVEYLLMHSAPLPVPEQVDGFARAVVLS